MDDRPGPLPALLLVLTGVTGLVDAVSYLKLGHVFVANMTGNVVFLGFAVADAADFSISASLVATAAFLAGAFAGGAIGSRAGHHRARLLAIAISLQIALVGAALVVSLLGLDPEVALVRYGAHWAARDRDGSAECHRNHVPRRGRRCGSRSPCQCRRGARARVGNARVEPHCELEVLVVSGGVDSGIVKALVGGGQCSVAANAFASRGWSG